MAFTLFDIKSRSILADGLSFGEAGQYEFVEGTLHYEIDPKHPDNELVTDINIALTAENGKVQFASDIQLLRPINPKPNSSLLLSIVNRGGRSSLIFNDAPNVWPTQEPDLGNGFLMRNGFTVVFCGWQTDVPAGGIRLHVPEALGEEGSRLTGQAYQQFNINSTTNELLLSDRGHKPLPVYDTGDPLSVLVERDWPEGPPIIVSKDLWSFGRWIDGAVVEDQNYICKKDGFQSGKVYEIIYNTVGAPVIGLGFLAVRDCASFFKYGSAEDGNPCADTIDRAYAHGSSQTGRFLREFLYLGLNLDEEGRLVYDGALPHTASSRFGEFNIRFGQPSSNHLRNVGNRRAVSYTEQMDATTGESDGLLKRLEAKGAVPKIIATNSAVEHWWSDAVLAHMDSTCTYDLELPGNVRVYNMAGTKHGSGSVPLTNKPGDGPRQHHWSNIVDYRPLLRGALVNLDAWVRHGIEPPDSCIPRISDGTAVPRESLRSTFTSIPGMGFPVALPVRVRLDYGDSIGDGVPNYPPREGEPYVTLVSAVDRDGNEVAGVKLPDVSVPLATHTGWTMRHREEAGAGHFIPLQGASVPFARALHERQSSGDPRPSIAERYSSKRDYLTKVRAAISILVDDGYILPEDTDSIVKASSQRWDAIQLLSQQKTGEGRWI